MIHGIYANQASFHPVEFKAGLNVILAERTDTSTQKDTRNGLGKSTLIDIIDFCLGSRAQRNKGLYIEPLESWAFTVDITLAGKRVKVTRAVSSPNRFVIDGETSGWIEQPDIDEETGDHYFTWEGWKRVLGGALFGLRSPLNEPFKYKPTYRSLISYFLRTGHDAYGDPFRHYRNQKTWDSQLHVGFLLGLNWEYASRWQELKDKEDALKAVSQAMETGAMGDSWGSVGELEAEQVRLKDQVQQEKVALDSFRVHPQYEAVQLEADQLTAQIHELVNLNVADRRRLARYKESIEQEVPPANDAFERLYAETGLVFPDAVRRTLADAKEFHQRIIENRKAFLDAEIGRLDGLIQQREAEIKGLTEERATSLEVLRNHGALQEMTALQERHVESKSKLEQIRERISSVKDAKSRKREIKVEKAELVRVAEMDHDQRRDSWEVAVRLFNDNSLALYQKPGNLVINVTETGYRYKVEIERSGSEGIGKMKVFCFDLMLLELAMSHSYGIDFLMHDSTLYDGVDSRQRALAIQRAHEVCTRLGGQYICALNSDVIPRQDFEEGFNFDEHVRLTLTDKSPEESLLGFRFERPGK